MSDILRTTLAPVNDAAWGPIREEATRTLKGHLSARRVVPVEGPHGWTHAAVNLGRVRPIETQDAGGVRAGVREVLPLVEVRVPFTLDLWELDDAERGAADIELAPVADAARKLALFEEGAVYGGYAEGGIRGIAEQSPHDPVVFAAKPEALVRAVADGVLTLQEAGIGGPYALVLDADAFTHAMSGDIGGVPIRERIGQAADGGVHWSPAVSGGLLVSRRGGDFELTLGQDTAIGYAGHAQGKVDLFLTESFTFRVLDPAAAIALRAKG